MALGTPVAAAAAYSGTAGAAQTVSPAYPAGILATDVVLLFVGQKPTAVAGGTVATPNGWTLREELTNAGGYSAQGADSGNTNLRVYSWNTPVAGQTGTLAVTMTGNDVAWAFMVRIPKGTGAAEFGSADGQRTTAPTVNVAFATALTNGASATNFQSGDRAIWAMCIPTDITTPSQFSAQSITATGATFGTAAELNEPDSGTNNDIGGYSAWAAVTAGSSTTAPTVTVTAAGTVTNVRGPVVLLRVREGAAPQTLTPALFTNTQTFHNPTVTPGAVALAPSLFTNDQTFFSPDVTQGGGTQALTASLFTNDQTFFAPSATATYSLTPGKYDNAQTFYAASVTQTGGPQTLLPDLYTNAQSFFAPTVAASNTLTPALYTNAQTFFAPTVTAIRTLTPALYTNAQTFFAPTAAATYSLTPALYTNEQTFYAATVTSGTTLAPNRYDNTQTFYGPTVARGAVDLAPSLYTNTQTFFAPTVTPGAINLQPALVTNDQEFYSPVVGQVGGLQTLLPDLVENTQTFFAPTVTPGVVVLAPQGYVDDGYVDDGYVGPNTFSTQVFYAPTVTPTNVVAPALVTNTSQFFTATVENSLLTITKAQALRLLQIHLLHGLAASPLVVSASSRSAGAVEQLVTQSGTTVTISTTAAPSVFSGDAGALIDELAALHGLTADLIVTPTSRTAGAISQTLAQAGTTTTVTRV